MHKQLLVCIALQFWLRIESLRPRLLHDLRATSRLALIQRVDCAEVDLLIDLVLQCRCKVVCVVVCRAFGVDVAVMVVLIMAMRHGLCNGVDVLAGEQLRMVVLTFWCCCLRRKLA